MNQTKNKECEAQDNLNRYWEIIPSLDNTKKLGNQGHKKSICENLQWTSLPMLNIFPKENI
jgi:hypothetical protein